jgi:hypothetical protein
MRMLPKLVPLIVAMVTYGCVSMPPVKVDATPADKELLLGQWHGEYTSPALGRRGSIEFKLVAGQEQAKGFVLMTPQGASKPYEPSSLGQEQDVNRPSSALLTIRFVRAANSEVSGVLDPYWDPDRNCEATTTFKGYLTTGTMEGTFITTWDCGAGEASGRWHVTRKPAKQTESTVNRHVN